jgi:hypothetical protein
MNSDDFYDKMINGYIDGYTSISGINIWTPINQRGPDKWTDGNNHYVEYQYFAFGRNDKLIGRSMSIRNTSKIIKTEDSFIILNYDVNKKSKVLIINEKEKYKSSYEASIALENYSKLIKV